MRKLGDTQRSILRSMQERGHWYPGCGWVWSDRSGTVRLLDSLARRGLVTRTETRYGPRYDITEAGRAA